MVRTRTFARRRAGALVAATAAALALTGTAAPASALPPGPRGPLKPAEAPLPAEAAEAAPPAGPPLSAGPLLPAGPADPAGAVAASESAALLSLTVALPRGHDVSSHQEGVDWRAARVRGARFVYVKATESTDYHSPDFSGQYTGARKAGLIRGAYHFARPDRSSGARQAAYFVRHGGDWRPDGWTLPPALDIEYNPYSKKHKCYGLNRERMVRWIRSFSDETKRETGRRPVIYTTTQWWKQCTGNSRAFSSSHALWIARHGTSRPGPLPGGWRYWTFWQYGIKGALPGDQNLFNGSLARLRIFARGR
ncbi:lysozyme [Streptomyces naphthomycinicus]|uniref:lysozyme n=1 Tax=Streptomyces naphthomycinicus TaxID=2872625 RepID=UPI001CECA92B|nr:lysozyme [Streptomyces sp. TML10]